ncbi:molybdenum ABC transporter substrate-binding protein [Malaciobacter halophilus]|nr:substrate-binding domain-containing protein [Malaciobacter halophilus]RYA24400.1 molybdenum ABC transporter substrate-binding protein [Malaciobacter halophilus]
MFKQFFILIFTTFIINSTLMAKQKPTLIFYCGITMVKPIKQMAKIIEEKYNCNIKISQGGSKDLYDALKYSKKGDLYLPGSDSYRIKNKKDSLIIDSAFIGYNQAAIFVEKNNPLKIKDLDAFVNSMNSSILCNPNSGSIGKMTKKIFLAYKGEKFFNEAYDNAIEIGTDSRNLNRSLIEKRTNITINWKATAMWNENSKHIDVIEIDEKYAPKKRLEINLLSFSKNKKIAKAFMEFAKSKQGQQIMKEYGF